MSGFPPTQAISVSLANPLLARAVRGAAFAVDHPSAFVTVRRLQTEGLTFLGFAALADVFAAVSAIERRNIPGVIIEAGTAAGGSGIVIAAAKDRQRSFFAYDVFGLIPPPSDRDGADVHARYEQIAAGKARGPKGTTYYGYEEDLLDVVRKNFQRYRIDPEKNRVNFIRGLYEDTLRIEEPVAFAHIDCDWYDSVLTCLQRITPRLQRGGVMIIDDYFSWSGCRAAVDDYFQDKRGEFTFTQKARLHIARTEL